MSSRWFTLVVVLFWVATMSWLVVMKVSPPLVRGEPPNYQRIVAQVQKHPSGVLVDVLGQRPIGRATTIGAAS